MKTHWGLHELVFYVFALALLDSFVAQVLIGYAYILTHPGVWSEVCDGSGGIGLWNSCFHF